MGFPKTLIGIISFVLVSGYIISLVMDENNSNNELEKIVSSMQAKSRNSLNDSESSGGFSGFFSMLGSIIDIGWFSLMIILASVSSFVSIPITRGLPTESYIIFVIIFISAIISIIKVIWSGE